MYGRFWVLPGSLGAGRIGYYIPVAWRINEYRSGAGEQVHTFRDCGESAKYMY